MRGVRSGFTVWLLAVTTACHALEPLSETDFSDLLEAVHRLNRWDPKEASRLAVPAQETLAFEASMENQIRVAVALAPANSIRNGYRPVRDDLAKLLGPAHDSPDSGVLIPEIRFGLSDLALRNGEIRFSFRQIVGAYNQLDSSAPDWLKWRLLEQSARINLAAGYPFDTLHLINRLEQMGAFQNAERRLSLQLLRTEALGDACKFDEMAAVSTN